MNKKQNIQKQKEYKPIYGAIIIPITVIIFCIMIIFINYNRVAIIKDFTITETFNETTLCATYNINSDINVEKLILEFTYYDKDHKKTNTIEKEIGTLKSNQSITIEIQLPKDISFSFTDQNTPECTIEVKKGNRTFT